MPNYIIHIFSRKMETYNLHEKTTYYINIKYVHKEKK